MEDPTAFNLNEAVQSWRQSLAASPSLTAENLDELESHLRDGVERLQPIGLSPAEAFMVARARIGSADRLVAEFAKANPERLWVDRIKWMIVGVILAKLISQVADMVGTLVTTATRQAVLFGPDATFNISLALGLVARVGAAAALVLWGLRLSKRRTGQFHRFEGWSQSRPFLASTVVFAGYVVVTLLHTTIFYLSEVIYRRVPSELQDRSTWFYFWILASMLIWPALLVWTFVRTSQKAVAK